MQIAFVPYHAMYAVKIDIEHPFPSDQADSLQYDISIRYLKREGEYHSFEVSKSDIVLNEEEVQDAFHDILLMTAQAVDKIVVKTDGTGKAIGMGNLPEALQKWKQARELVEAQYEGEAVSDTWTTWNKTLLPLKPSGTP